MRVEALYGVTFAAMRVGQPIVACIWMVFFVCIVCVRAVCNVQGTSLSFELNIEERTLLISSGTATHKASLGDKLTTPLYICASSTLSVGKVGRDINHTL